MTAELPATEDAFRRTLADAVPGDRLPREVYADWLDDQSRAYEARLCRGEAKLAFTTAGRVVREADLMAAGRHGRVARPAPGLTCSVYCGRRRGGDVGRRVGEAVRRSTGMYVVVAVGTPYHVSDDQIEDMDAWHDYPDGPGYYGTYEVVAVEETDAETAAREKEEEAAAAKAKAAASAAAEVKAKVESEWTPVADLPRVYSLPAGVIVTDWRTVDAPVKGYGTTLRVGTLPDGRSVGHATHTSYDDQRSYYYVPADIALAATLQSARANAQDADDARRYIAQYGGCEGHEHYRQLLAACEADPVLAAELKELADGRRTRASASAAVDALRDAARQHPAGSPERAAGEAIWCDAADQYVRDHGYAEYPIHTPRREARGGELRRLWDTVTAGYRSAADAATGDEYTALERRYVEYGDTAARVECERLARAAVESVRAAVDAEWAAAGEGQPADVVAQAREERDRYPAQHETAAGYVAAVVEERAEAEREAAAKAAKAAARKADPMVIVVGDTYPHRDALQRIPGSKLSKLKAGWTWKVPRSQVDRLPKGLRWEA